MVLERRFREVRSNLAQQQEEAAEAAAAALALQEAAALTEERHRVALSDAEARAAAAEA
eukprot:COSAG01_NODE_25614_length_739_cov_1.487500_2_plen_58_part_01